MSKTMNILESNYKLINLDRIQSSGLDYRNFLKENNESDLCIVDGGDKYWDRLSQKKDGRSRWPST
jgi:hypothetical protein